MVTWGVTEPTAGAVASASTYVVGATDWDSGFSVSALDDGGRTGRTDSLAGTVSELSLPTSRARIGRALVVGDSRTVDAGRHRLVCEYESSGTVVTATVAFEAPGTVHREADRTRLCFDAEKPVRVTVEEAMADRDTVVVPPTTDGIARAISILSGYHETATPARSDPDRRPTLPLVRVEAGADLPPAGRRDLTLTVPDSTEALYVAAPLAYYLGARVETAAVERPRLRSATAAVDHRFEPLPAFQDSCAALLRRVFYLDCHCRRESDSDALSSSLRLDATALRERSTAERVARYLALDADTVDDRLPEWHLSTYVDPTVENLTALPHLLADMSQVYLPNASDLDDDELLNRTLTDAYRAAAEAPSVEVCDPELRSGQVHAWLAEGTPIDAYKTTTTAYHNRTTYGRRPNGPLSVTVVLNDGAMREERDTVADIYREQVADRPIDVTVREDLTVEELAAEFATPTDFLHYIGHCETTGLRCPDGTLSASELPQSRTRTFFLNACGSFHEGMALVEQGSLAGAVTLEAVLDEQAATVGTTFARLLAHGFSIERAMQLARRQVLMCKDYAVVGDGTSSLVPVPEEEAVVHLERAGEQYSVSYEALQTRANGSHYECPFVDTPRLCGRPTECRVTPAEARDAFVDVTLPVVYDGTLRWSAELATEL